MNVDFGGEVGNENIIDNIVYTSLILSELNIINLYMYIVVQFMAMGL